VCDVTLSANPSSQNRELIEENVKINVFWELLHEEVLANYIDNFVILAKTKRELEERTIQFLKVAEKYNLYFKQSKCNFDAKEISILGVVIWTRRSTNRNKKAKTVKEWKILTKIKEVESFLGFINFYKCFIKNFSHKISQ